MEPDRDTLNAFVDGELPPKEMERIAALLAARPDLDRYVRDQERLRSELRQAYRLETSVPERLKEAVQTTPVSQLWRWRAFFRRWLSVRNLAPAGAALAIGLAIGFVLRPAADYGTDSANRLIAQGTLANALSTELAASRGTGPRVGISFRSKSGRDCRTFNNGEDAGLACREERAWIIEMLAKQQPEYPGAAYRMVGSEMPDAVRRAVAASIAGAPFDAAAEKLARERGWSGR